MADELWSIPPIISDTPTAIIPDISVMLEQGVIYDIRMGIPHIIQNVSENEDDYIEFCHHGDRDGTWHVLNTHSIIKTNKEIFLLNRSHKANVMVAITEVL